MLDCRHRADSPAGNRISISSPSTSTGTLYWADESTVGGCDDARVALRPCYGKSLSSGRGRGVAVGLSAFLDVRLRRGRLRRSSRESFWGPGFRTLSVSVPSSFLFLRCPVSRSSPLTFVPIFLFGNRAGQDSARVGREVPLMDAMLKRTGGRERASLSLTFMKRSLEHGRRPLCAFAKGTVEHRHSRRFFWVPLFIFASSGGEQIGTQTEASSSRYRGTRNRRCTDTGIDPLSNEPQHWESMTTR